MSEMQDSISALYILISHHGNDMAGCDAGARAVVRAARAMLFGLQSEVLVQEALASATVVVWVAALVPNVPPQRVAAQLAEGVLLTETQRANGMMVTWQPPRHDINATPGSSNNTACVLNGCSGDEPDGCVGMGVLEAGLRQAGSSLQQEMSRLSQVCVRLCV
jgi:hypothetical protein